MLLKICKTALEKDIVLSSLKVALIVGGILNIINQGNVIFTLNFKTINWFTLLLNFVVPYLVSTYASVRTRLKKG